MKAFKVLLALGLVLALGACAKPPQADIDAARAAVAAAAQNADVGSYAPESLKAAQDTLARMEAELKAKRYDKVKTLALEAKAKAGTAINDAAANKTKAQADASALVDALKKALPDADKKIAAARRVPGVKLDFKAVAAQLAQVKADVAEAAKALAAGDYATALAKATGAQTALAAGEKAVTDAIALATGKKK